MRFLLFTSRYRSTLNVMVVCEQTKHLMKGKLHVAAAESWSVPSLPSGYFSRGAIRAPLQRRVLYSALDENEWGCFICEELLSDLLKPTQQF